jgi:hypothetical protein
LNRKLKQFSCVAQMVGPEGFEPSTSRSLRWSMSFDMWFLSL